MLFRDRVKETTATTGTGNLTLAGAVAGFQSFSNAFGTAASQNFYYCIEAIDGSGAPTGDWEVGEGYLSAATTLVRSRVIASSNSGLAVNLAVGTKNVFGNYPAFKNSAPSPFVHVPSTTLFNYSATGTSIAWNTPSYDNRWGFSIARNDTGAATADRAAIYGKTVASGSWTATAIIKQNHAKTTEYNRYGLGIYNSTSGKMLFVGNNNQGASTWSPIVYYMTNLQTFSSNLGGAGPFTFPTIFLRIAWDGTTYTFYVSYDEGVAWTSLATATAASYFTATHIGICSETYGTTSSNIVLNCIYYNDPDFPGGDLDT